MDVRLFRAEPLAGQGRQGPVERLTPRGRPLAGQAGGGEGGAAGGGEGGRASVPPHQQAWRQHAQAGLTSTGFSKAGRSTVGRYSIVLVPWTYESQTNLPRGNNRRAKSPKQILYACAMAHLEAVLYGFELHAWRNKMPIFISIQRSIFHL